MENKELVIAAYDKSLEWKKSINEDVKITVYRKGDVLPLSEGEIKIETNKGRCVHTFFNHIKNNYYKLSDYTFFVQDYPFDHWEDVIDVVNGNIETFKNRSALNIGGYYGYHFNTIKIPSERGGIMHTMHESKDHGGGKIISCYSNGMPHDTNPNINVDSYWDIFFDCSKPVMYEFMPGGHFGISKEHARLRSIDMYKKIVELLESDPNSPWVFERLECYIFNPKYKSKI